ncbi:MAG: hypothetical protein ACRCV3_02990 [Desulfovibrionaceae bacterium]
MIVLVSATKEEMLASLSCTEHSISPDVISVMKDGDTLCTQISTKEVLLVLVGVGPVNAAYYMGKNISQCKNSLIIHCGIAGTYNTNSIPVGSICYVKEEVYLEYGRVTGAGIVEQLPYRHYDLQENTNRCEIVEIRSLLEKYYLRYVEFPHVESMSTACVSADRARVQQIKRQYPLAAIENMEGFSVGISARKNGIDYIGIRSISNIAGDKESWDIVASFSVLGKTIQKIFG